MDRLTEEEFHTFARDKEIYLTDDRSPADIAGDLFKNHGWLDFTIRFEQDTDAGTLHMWIE